MTETTDRRQNLDAALAVFSQKGFDRANVSDVAARAGISQGTVYWYLESKEALLQQLTAKALDDVLQPLQAILNRTDLSPLERLRRSFRTSLALFRAHSKEFRLLFSLWAQPPFPEPEAGETSLLDRIYRHHILPPLTRVIQGAMDAGEIAPGDAEALTVASAALVDGLMLYSMIWPEGLVSDERLEAAMRRLLQPLS